MDDKSFHLWAEIDEAGKAGNPWGIMALEFHQVTEKPIEECVDNVIVHYLRLYGQRPVLS